ncbi:MAG: hypothetical protein KDK45_25470, partial [Leptospiraceae bacterium]|nr:hypothetical protein [Leptospiraceae bacterium]
IICQGCKKKLDNPDNIKPSQSEWKREDSYGIFTGVYCEECYNSNKYPYRKDRYYDSAYAGERLDEDY